MRKIFLTTCVALAGAAVFARGAEEPTKTSNTAIIKKSESTFALVYQAEESATVKVSIRDEANKLVFVEVLRDVNGFIRPYNFSTLPEGNYSIVIEGEGTKQVEKIAYFAGTSQKRAFVTKLVGDRFLVSAPVTQEEQLTIRIYNQRQQLLHKETHAVDSDFAKIYRIEKLDGAVTFEVVRGNGKAELITM